MRRFIRRFVIIIADLLLGPTVYAGAGGIHGTVKGGDDPIAGATIRILELDRTTRSDAGGEFTFRDVPPGAYTLFVRVVGYAPAKSTVQVREEGAEAEASFMLRESAIEMEEIVVSASPYARPADEQYQSAESKSMVDLHQSAGSSFAEKISDLPGVTVRSNGSARRVRSCGGSRTIVC